MAYRRKQGQKKRPGANSGRIVENYKAKEGALLDTLSAVRAIFLFTSSPFSFFFPSFFWTFYVLCSGCANRLNLTGCDGCRAFDWFCCIYCRRPACTLDLWSSQSIQKYKNYGSKLFWKHCVCALKMHSIQFVGLTHLTCCVAALQDLHGCNHLQLQIYQCSA